MSAPGLPGAGTFAFRRLRHIRALLTARGTATDATRLQCYSGAGFTDEPRRLTENDSTIQLIDPPRLYHGD